MSTPYHATYFSHVITQHHSSGSVEKLTHSLFDACVDLNPHQIEAALFAIQSPLSKGAILADEVGLGKTIEAGLLLCQYWAERRRRLLIICPASLRKQWSNELREKFHLPNIVADSRTMNNDIPFDQPAVYIMSIHFAARNSIKLRTVDWDLVVIDEAHKLRNVFKRKNKMAQSIKWAVQNHKKILLTATPLQNSLMELYGLATLIDEHYFGDADSFRKQFVNKNTDYQSLQNRLTGFCHRSLRNDVTEYIRYTERRSMTLPYHPTDEEQQLYDSISDFIARDDTYSIPAAQRHLMTLVIRKILASSRYAITKTLEKMKARLIALRQGANNQQSLFSEFIDDEAIDDEALENYTDELEANPNENQPVDFLALENEIKALEALISLAQRIKTDKKFDALLEALKTGFGQLKKMNALRKAVIFTESRRTQEYLLERLGKSGYAGKIVIFNGVNSDSLSTSIYQQWLEKNKDSGVISGSRSVDMRTALIEHFRDNADILIATEAAAEGINLQFCSLLINYDLPWNPQRIEQRIGRCHRYGQKHDVVVINFLNERNETDQRVYELLDSKFELFNGVFGASDEILGRLDSGLDFEQRIHRIYQECRDAEEIEQAFQQLQSDMDDVIQNKMHQTKQILLNHFDRDVHSRLKVNLRDTREHLDHIGAMFWTVTKYVLDEVAEFDDRALTFDLHRSPLKNVQNGHYYLISKSRQNVADTFLYRLSHPLGEFVLAAGKNTNTKPAQVYFDMSNHPEKISPLKKLKDQSGWMALTKLTLYSYEEKDVLIFAGLTDDGKILDQELCENFFHLRGGVSKTIEVPAVQENRLNEMMRRQIEKQIAASAERDNEYFRMECEKLDQWADDMVAGVERDLENNKKRLRASIMQARMTDDAKEQHSLQLQVRELEKEKRHLRSRLFEMEDDIMAKRNLLISKLEKHNRRESSTELFFMLRWTII